MRYYVDNSSWFDNHPYNVNQISKAVKEAGGERVSASNNYGWSNQPKVVTFTATEAKVDKITQAVAKAVGTQWIIVREKDW